MSPPAHNSVRTSNSKHLQRLERLASSINSIDMILSSSHFLGLSPVIAVLKVVVDTLKARFSLSNARSNLEDAFNLAERLCNLCHTVSSQCNKLMSKEMQNYIKDFCVTAGHIKETIQAITSQGATGSFIRTLWGMNAQIINDCNKRIDVALELFKLQSDLIMHNETVSIKSKIDALGKDLTTLKSCQTKTANSTPIRQLANKRANALYDEAEDIIVWKPDIRDRPSNKVNGSRSSSQSTSELRRRIEALGRDLRSLNARESLIEPLKKLSSQCNYSIKKSRQGLSQLASQPHRSTASRSRDHIGPLFELYRSHNKRFLQSFEKPHRPPAEEPHKITVVDLPKRSPREKHHAEVYTSLGRQDPYVSQSASKLKGSPSHANLGTPKLRGSTSHANLGTPKLRGSPSHANLDTPRVLPEDSSRRGQFAIRGNHVLRPQVSRYNLGSSTEEDDSSGYSSDSTIMAFTSQGICSPETHSSVRPLVPNGCSGAFDYGKGVQSQQASATPCSRENDPPPGGKAEVARYKYYTHDSRQLVQVTNVDSSGVGSDIRHTGRLPSSSRLNSQTCRSCSGGGTWITIRQMGPTSQRVEGPCDDCHGSGRHIDAVDISDAERDVPRMKDYCRRWLAQIKRR
ncbi:hypothetical protein BU17DRAFT_99947 [Hysterangium stoloniferum]|nr:hypothetical protein BU17DRAFT_99947 [Hysterangium stoloniferum]